MRLVLASNNAKKLTELRALLGALPLELVAQGALGIAEAEEPHATFVENALAKARHAARATGLPAIADDSGLCVDALGVHANQLVRSRASSSAAARARWLCAFLVAASSSATLRPSVGTNTSGS